MCDSSSCDPHPLIGFGREWARVPYGSEDLSYLTFTPDAERGRCGDCGVVTGGTHHTFCDLEQCPRCREQLFSCDCEWEASKATGDE